MAGCGAGERADSRAPLPPRQAAGRRLRDRVMIEALLHAGNVAFTAALGVMLLVAAVEGVGAVLGASISEHLHALLPNTDLDANLDLDASEAIVSPFAKALTWLRVGQVPVLMLLVAFLTIFGLGGLLLQRLAMGALGISANLFWKAS